MLPGLVRVPYVFRQLPEVENSRRHQGGETRCKRRDRCDRPDRTDLSHVRQGVSLGAHDEPAAMTP